MTGNLAQQKTYLPRCTLCPIQRRPFLGFAEVRVVRVTAPKLFTWIKGAELKHTSRKSQVNVI